MKHLQGWVLKLPKMTTNWRLLDSVGCTGCVAGAPFNLKIRTMTVRQWASANTCLRWGGVGGAGSSLQFSLSSAALLLRPATDPMCKQVSGQNQPPQGTKGVQLLNVAGTLMKMEDGR